MAGYEETKQDARIFWGSIFFGIAIALLIQLKPAVSAGVGIIAGLVAYSVVRALSRFIFRY